MLDCTYKNCGRPAFSRGVCRSHYDKERMARMPKCSVELCNRKASRKGMCDAHYRADLHARSPECIVPACEGGAVALGYCNKHHQRLLKHGHIHPTRGIDWGAREEHPLYQTYQWHKNRTKNGMDDVWADDFWRFVEDVGERPNDHVLTGRYKLKPIGPQNWMWREKAFRGNSGAEYQRHYRKTKSRNVKNTRLKSKYGITIDQHDAMLESQGGVCAICKSPPKGKRYSSFVVDHCHDKGTVRGLLCDHCNRAIGLMGDSPDTLRAAATYLEKFM